MSPRQPGCSSLSPICVGLWSGPMNPGLFHNAFHDVPGECRTSSALFGRRSACAGFPAVPSSFSKLHPCILCHWGHFSALRTDVTFGVWGWIRRDSDVTWCDLDSSHFTQAPHLRRGLATATPSLLVFQCFTVKQSHFKANTAIRSSF